MSERGENKSVVALNEVIVGDDSDGSDFELIDTSRSFSDENRVELEPQTPKHHNTHKHHNPKHDEHKQHHNPKHDAHKHTSEHKQTGGNVAHKHDAHKQHTGEHKPGEHKQSAHKNTKQHGVHTGGHDDAHHRHTKQHGGNKHGGHGDGGLPHHHGDEEKVTASGHETRENTKTSSTSKESEDKEDSPKNKKKNKNKNKKKVNAEEHKSIEAVFEDLKTNPKGLTSEEAKTRLEKYGPNALPQHDKNPVMQFLKFLWSPLAWVMEIAAIVSICLVDYVDFCLIVALLLINAIIAFLEERSAGKAIAALQDSLAPNCWCYRDGKIKELDTADLVPGDIAFLKSGSVIPADCYLLSKDPLIVDQSALTGESLPSTKHKGDVVYSGSITKQGESKAIVYATGSETFFGKAADLVAVSEKSGQFHKILTQVGLFCIGVILLGVIVELIVQFGVRRKPCTGVLGECRTLNNILVLLVGGIPVAMPTVLSVTLAIGAYKLAKKDAIVSHLTAIEELAAMDILCSDKTGTLTLNKLTLSEATTYSKEYSSDDVVFWGAAGVSDYESADAIDKALVNALSDEQKDSMSKNEIIDFIPFNPTDKFTLTTIKTTKGKTMYLKKGAPQVILRYAHNKDKIEKRVHDDINKYGKTGYRCIGVSVSHNGKTFDMIGLVPLFDPPREDTADTIKKCRDMGIGIKMITGDQLVIAKETARQLELGTNFLPGEIFRDKQKTRKEYGVSLNTLIDEADGFAEVYPEEKYNIVKNLHKHKHIVGMTGDGVNDSAALKRADIGIAVAGATDAARGAADIVLKTPGLSVIIEAIIGSRKIFQRMKTYCIYSVTVAVRVVLTFGVLTVAYDWYFPTIAIVILAILNDGCMMAISRDKVSYSPLPDKWNPIKVFASAICYGIYLSISTIVLYELILTDFFPRTFGLQDLNGTQGLVGLIYLQVSVGGLALIFIARSRSFSFMNRPSIAVLVAFVIAQVIASVIAAYGLNDFEGFSGCGWAYVLVAWIWCIIWYIPLDIGKVLVVMLFDWVVHHIPSSNSGLIGYIGKPQYVHSKETSHRFHDESRKEPLSHHQKHE